MTKQTRGYRVWDPASEDALKAGVRKHGLGAWEHIRKDPQFAILSDRTGVQLKDKWRNLVKFRHIDPDEQRTYKPKTQGPWSKKYKRDRSQGPSGTASPASGDGGASEDEGAQHMDIRLQLPGLPANGADGGEAALALALAQHPHALQAQRHSFRSGAQKRKAATDLAMVLHGEAEGAEPGTCSGDDDGPGGGGEDGGDDAARRNHRHRSSSARPPGLSAAARHSLAKQRKAHEDRRFGIYDRRRYGFTEDGQPLPGRTPDGADGSGAESGGEGGGAAGFGSGGGGHAPRPRRRAPIGRRGGRGRTASDDEEEDDDGSDGEYDDGSDEDHRHRRAGRGGGAADGADGADAEQEVYIIRCPCGVTYDDGEMMIECESCAAWAHTACLRQQMATDPARYRYNFDTYHCSGCQAALQQLQNGPSPKGHGAVAAAAAAAPGALPHGLIGVGSGVAAAGAGAGAYNGPAEGGRRSLAANGGGGGGRGGIFIKVEPLGGGDGCDGGEPGDGDQDSASEDSQRKATEALLGMASGLLGNVASTGGASGSRRNGLGPAGHAGSGFAKPGSFNGYPRPVSPGVVRTASVGRSSSTGLGGGSGGAAAAGAAALDGSARLLKPGAGAAAGAADGVRRGGMGGPANSNGSRGRLEGAASPPPIPDGGLPLFQSTGNSSGAGAGGGTKIFKPIPKLATAPGAALPGAGAGPQQPQHQQLSAPKARPHPALQRGTSQQNMQRMLEAANPLAAAAGAGGGSGLGGSLGLGGGGSLFGRCSMPLASVLDAAGPLQVAAANLCAASGRKAAAHAPAATGSASGGGGGAGGGGGPAASDGVGSNDAAGLPPRPASSMAREVANRIFGESDDDDGGLGRPLSALARGGDPWLLMPPSLSRAATPSFIDTLLRATPDIIPLTGSSPPPHLAAALAAVRTASPGAAFLPALFAQQQQQQQAAMQHFLQQTVAAPRPLGPPMPPGVLLPPPPLARPTPLAPPPPPFAPPPLGLGGGPTGWLSGAPPPPLPPPIALHSSSNGGGATEPVTLHPVLQHLLLQQQQQQQAQQQAQQQLQQQAQKQHDQRNGLDGVSQQLPHMHQTQQQQPHHQDAGAGPMDAVGPGVGVKQEEGSGGPPPPSLNFAAPQQQQQQQPHLQPQTSAGRAAGGEEGSSGAVATSVTLHPALSAPQVSRPPSANGDVGTSGGGGGGGGGGPSTQGPNLRDAGGGAAAGAAAGGGGAGGASLGLDGSGGSGGSGGAGAGAGGNSSVAALLGLGMGGLHLGVLDHLRSSSPDPWGIFRTTTPGPEALLQSFLHPQPALPLDMNSLPWLKSATPPLTVGDVLGQPPSAGANMQLER